jgi:hypothetical protein
MSLENCGVFQLLKKVTFQSILMFCNLRNWGHFGSGKTDDLESGSALLIAHHTDVIFVSVKVGPISTQR